MRTLVSRSAARAALAAASLGLGALALLAAPLAAHAAPAEEPVDLAGAYVADESGVLGSDAARVEASLDALFENRGTGLYVVLVPSFDGAPDAQSWADQSANLSGLGDDQILLALATDDREFAVSTGATSPVTDDQIDAAIDDQLIPALRDDRWADGIVDFANALDAAQAPSPAGWIFGGVAAAGAGGIVTAIVVSNRRKKKAVALSDDELETRAGSSLVALDDALKTSEEELGFAEAQFGAEQTGQFRSALESAKAKAQEAFAIQQKLDDSVPETPEQRRAMLEQVLALTTAADEELDAQADAFDELREIEKDLPAAIEELGTRQAELDATIARGEKELASLTTSYDAAELDAVDDAPEQARDRAEFAASSLEKARAAQAAGDGTEAAVAVRGAQQAIAQAEQLVASIGTLGAELAARAKRKAEATEALAAAIQDARASITATQDYISARRGGVGATARTRVSEAERHLATATSLATSDPEKALAEARQAQDLAAAGLESARSDVQQAQRSAVPTGVGSGGSFSSGVLGGLIGSSIGNSTRGGFGGSSRSGGGLFGGSGGGSLRSGGSSRSGGSVRRSSTSSSSRSSSSRTSGRRGRSGRF